MDKTTERILLPAAGVLICLGLATAPIRAETPAAHDRYPVKPVRMIVPLAPGGGSDIVGRIVASSLSGLWSQPVIVDNRPGAGTAVGMAVAARAPADGYTVIVSSSSMAISPALRRNPGFDVKHDFDEVTLIASQPSILAVHPSLPANSFAELIALAKSQPGRLAFASAGPGSATHLGTELLMHAAGIRLLHVPYRSAGQATMALLAGETQVLFTNMASLLPHIRSGKARALGVSSPRRLALAPDLPTIAEAGIPGFEYATWYGMLVPAGTPQSVIERIHADTAKAVSAPHVQERFTNKGLSVHASPPGEFARYLDSELSRWSWVIRTAGIRPE
jgi:tripartite-type tricarboxylate transporter receptor subunit TctC